MDRQADRFVDLAQAISKNRLLPHLIFELRHLFCGD